MEMGNVLAVIGTIIVILFSLILAMLNGLRNDMIHLEARLTEKVSRPDCVREMDRICDNFKDIEQDVKDLIKGKI
jgi:hypothetical protein